MTGLNAHVRYVHAKFMIIDPVGERPILVTGSANFTSASATKNDENVLIFVGEPARELCEIYLVEFLRLFRHFEWRNRVLEQVERQTGVRLHPGKEVSGEEREVIKVA